MDTEGVLNVAAKIAQPGSWRSVAKSSPGQISPTVRRAGYIRRPQPGYIGKDYERTRIVFLGQNPGAGGKGEFDSRAWDIELFKQYLPNFVNNPSSNSFAELNAYLATILLEWPFFKQTEFDFPRSFGLRIEEIAYSNVLPVDSHEELIAKRIVPHRAIFRYSVERFIGPWLELLAPKVVVVFGKVAGGHLERYWNTKPRNVVITCVTHPSSKNRDLDKFKRELATAKTIVGKAFPRAGQRRGGYEARYR